MRIAFTIIAFISLLCPNLLFGQIDQVSTGPSYSQQAYYKISTGEVTQVSNEAWDIAFSSQGLQDAGVLINESSSFMSSSLNVYLSSQTDWSVPITDSASYVEADRLLNPKDNWTQGAFNTLQRSPSPFDYGWGSYDPMTNQVTGDRIFVIQLRDLSFIKFQIQQLSGIDYTFRYADLDGANESTVTITKNGDPDSPLIHFSFDTGDIVDVPSDYDLVFQRYITPLPDGTGDTIDYTVTGVLLSQGTEAVAAVGVDPMTVDEAEYKDQYSPKLETIGHQWKIFDFQSGWLVDADKAYFVKTNEGEIYKIVFLDFEGSSTGVTTFEKTLVRLSTSTQNIEDLDIAVYPNPTSDFLNVTTAEEDLQVLLYDAQGRLVYTQTKEGTSQQIDLTSFDSGVYNLILRGKDVFVTQAIIVNK